MKDYICRKLQYELERMGRKPHYSCGKVKHYLERIRRRGEPCLMAFLRRILNACSRGDYEEGISFVKRAVSGCCLR